MRTMNIQPIKVFDLIIMIRIREKTQENYDVEEKDDSLFIHGRQQ